MPNKVQVSFLDDEARNAVIREGITFFGKAIGCTWRGTVEGRLALMKAYEPFSNAILNALDDGNMLASEAEPASDAIILAVMEKAGIYAFSDSVSIETGERLVREAINSVERANA